MVEETIHFICIKLEGKTIDHEICIKIPDSEIDGLYAADKIFINIKRKTTEEHNILNKSIEGKIEK